MIFCIRQSTLKQEQVKQLGCEVARKLGCELHIVSTISRTGINRFWSRLTALSFENAIQRSAREDRLFTRSMGMNNYYYSFPGSVVIIIEAFT